MDHNVIVAIVLHDFENLDLMGFETSSIKVHEIAEKVEQFAFVVAIGWLFFNVFTDLLDQLKDYHLVIKHCFVVIVHFF
jgi:hypothetical protein